MAYFKKLVFDRTNGKLTFYKVTVSGTTFVDGDEEIVDLKTGNGTSTMFLISITKESTSAGSVYAFTVSTSSEQSGIYMLNTGFGYIDTNAVGNNLFPMEFGQFLDTGTVSMGTTVSPIGFPLAAITKQAGKFGCFVGENDLAELPPMPPMTVVMEDIQFYLALEAVSTSGTVTKYNIKMQRAAE